LHIWLMAQSDVWLQPPLEPSPPSPPSGPVASDVPHVPVSVLHRPPLGQSVSNVHSMQVVSSGEQPWPAPLEFLTETELGQAAKARVPRRKATVRIGRISARRVRRCRTFRAESADRLDFRGLMPRIRWPTEGWATSEA